MYTKCFEPASAGNVTVSDPFWSPVMETVRTQMIPYQWEALNDRVDDAEPSYSIRNFLVAAGRQKGEFGGCVFQDSDLYKWIEAASYSLLWRPDKELEATLDWTADLIAAAQQPDGYLNTYYIINGLEHRWTNLMDNHELYCAGHLIEAAVAHHKATGSEKLLQVVRRLADHIDTVFGPEPEKKKGYPGHEIIEMALMRLYGVTGEKRYQRLAQYFVDQRGQSPQYFEEEMKAHGNKCGWMESPLKMQYYQAAQPVRQQQDAVGHSVRAVYLYSGMADVALETGDRELAESCRRLWDSITQKRMYVTGGIGSSSFGESFTFDYDLPNDLAYTETCASIGLMFFARRMLELERRGEYADVMERALYNGVLSGMSLDGTKFFYVNPLEVLPEACEKDQRFTHVKYQRQKWFGCACCPPNIARLMASLGSYAYSAGEGEISLHLYLGGSFTAAPGGVPVSLTVESAFPWKGEVAVQVEPPAGGSAFCLALRLPGWSRKTVITVNGQEAPYEEKDGYALITREWRPGDRVVLQAAMPVELVQAHPSVRENEGKVAVMRGPLVYCLEQADNGGDLHRIRLSQEPVFAEKSQPDLLGGVVTLGCQADCLSGGWQEPGLYRSVQKPVLEQRQLTFVPYYAWTNRSPGEMAVWVRQHS